MIADLCFMKPHSVPHYRLEISNVGRNWLAADPRLRANGHIRPAFYRRISFWSYHRFMRLYHVNLGRMCTRMSQFPSGTERRKA